jgi:N-acetylneuraminic acid mutarotase
MIDARYGATAVLLKNGKVLISGGITTGNTLLATAEIYDPTTGIWSPTGAMKTARAYYVGVLLRNGMVLVAGGCTNSNCSAATSTAEIYDPNAGIWRATAKMSMLRYFFSATPLSDGSVLVEGGCNQGNCTTVTTSAEIYNPRTRVWAPTGQMKVGRDYHTATLLKNGKVLVTGGYTVTGASNSVEMYDPTTATWSAMASMISGRALHTATALPDGTVVIAGGLVGYLPGDVSEVYRPARNAWTATGSLNTKRAGPAAALLPNGHAIVTGGYSYTRPYYYDLASCELFDAATGTWSFTGSTASSRYEHALVVLGNGQVLAVGGLSDTGILSTAELYTP